MGGDWGTSGSNKGGNLEHFGFYPGHPEDAGVGQIATSSNRQALPSKSWINSVHAAPLCKGRQFRLTPLDEKKNIRQHYCLRIYS